MKASDATDDDANDAATHMFEFDETDFALEGMWMPNPGEYPPVKLPLDETNTVSDCDCDCAWKF